MNVATTPEEIHHLVNELNFAQKVERSLDLIRDAYHEHGDGLVVANSLGKGSVAVWDLAKRISPEIRAFIGGAGRRRAGRGRLVRPDESSLRRGLVRP